MKTNRKSISCVLLAMVLGLTAMTVPAAENEENKDHSEEKETVYVLADALGNPQKTFVNERPGENADLESFDQDNIDRPLPVSVSFRYELDGEAVEPEELAGRSGHLTIHVDYVDNYTKTAEINGKTVEMPVPFLAATILPLDSDVYSNIEVTNGRVIEAGAVSAVVCLGMPGLGDALNVGGYEDLSLGIEIPSGAVISADVTDYSNDGSYTILTGIPHDMDEEGLPFGFDPENIEIAGLDEQGLDLKALGSDPEAAKDQLTNDLNDLLTGINDLAEGAETLSSGADTLNIGAVTLSLGLGTLDLNSSELTDGADQIISAVLESSNEALAASAEAFGAAGIELDPLTLDNYAEELDRIEGALSAMDDNAADGEVFQSLEVLRGRLDGIKSFHDGLISYTEGVSKAASGAAELAGGTGQLCTGASQLAQGTQTLNEEVQKLSGYLDGDVREILDRIKAAFGLRYEGFMDENANSTLFIIKTDGI